MPIKGRKRVVGRKSLDDDNTELKKSQKRRRIKLAIIDFVFHFCGINDTVCLLLRRVVYLLHPIMIGHGGYGLLEPDR